MNDPKKAKNRNETPENVKDGETPDLTKSSENTVITGKVIPADNVTKTLKQNNGKNDARLDNPKDEITPAVEAPEEQDEEEEAQEK